MTNTTCEIRCLECKEWFKSGIHFGDAKSFFSSSLIGNLQQCSDCNQMTSCNSENMRFVERLPNGQVTIVEGKDAYDKK